MVSKHLHGEAFKLMKYECQNCDHKEILWNSRDGVTPFMIGCRNCEKGMMQHIDWHKDQYEPSHELKPGQRFFRDGTKEDAIRIMERRIKMFNDKGQPIDQETEYALMRTAKDQTGEFQPGWPTIDTAK